MKPLLMMLVLFGIGYAQPGPDCYKCQEGWVDGEHITEDNLDSVGDVETLCGPDYSTQSVQCEFTDICTMYTVDYTLTGSGDRTRVRTRHYLCSWADDVELVSFCEGMEQKISEKFPGLTPTVSCADRPENKGGQCGEHLCNVPGQHDDFKPDETTPDETTPDDGAAKDCHNEMCSSGQTAQLRWVVAAVVGILVFSGRH